MKVSCRFSVALLVAGLLFACGDGKDDETIRITIDKGGQKVTAESGARPTPREETVQPRATAEPRTTAVEPPGRVGPATGIAGDEGISFEAVAAKLDILANGRDGAKRNWGSLRGRTVTWSGTVHDIDVGRNGFKLYVRSHNPAPSGRYNITVAGDGQVAAARALGRGEQVRFSGTIHRADYGRGPEAVQVVLSDGRIR